ncbi:zinc knuckle CX2CX4HX4C containing protein, partial [Tanacetum coccineum]
MPHHSGRLLVSGVKGFAITDMQCSNRSDEVNRANLFRQRKANLRSQRFLVPGLAKGILFGKKGGIPADLSALKHTLGKKQLYIMYESHLSALAKDIHSAFSADKEIQIQKTLTQVPPVKESDDVIKPKRASRSGHSDVKLAPKYTFAISKPAVNSGKKGNKRGGTKSRELERIVEDVEFDDAESDGSEVRIEDEEVDGESSDRVMGRSGSEGIEGNEGPVGVETEVSEVSLGNVVNNVEKVKKSFANRTNVIGDMPVPFSENIILNPGVKVSNEHRNDVRKQGYGNGDANGMVWPSLNEAVRKDNGSNGAGSNAMDMDMLKSTSGTKPMSFISTMQGMNASGNNKLSKIPVRVNKEGNNVVDMDPLLEEGGKKWDLTLVGYFVGLKMSYAEISGHLRRMWRTRDLAEIINNECGLYFMKFRSVEGMNYVLENGPWLIMNVPLEAWNTHGISRLASSLGNPIIMDRITASMCEKAYGRASFARVLVKVDATKELADSIEFCYSSTGKSMKLRVKYAWKPPLCTHCKVFGHDFKNCNVRQRTEEERNERVNDKKHDLSNDGVDSLKANGGWQSVRRPIQNVASTSKNIGLQFVNGTDDGNKGGNYGRGRGGMYGRGGLNGGRGGLSGGRGGMFQKENYEGVGKKFVPVRNVGQRVDNVHVMEGESSGSRVDKSIDVSLDKNGSVKKTSVKEGVNIRNSFEALVDDAVEIGGEEWVEMRSKIDLACELGMQIDDNEKKRWSEDLKKYYDDKCEANIKKNMISGLKWRIAKLQQDIVHINTYVTSVAKEGAEKQCVGIMKKEGITRNQAYGKIYDEIYKSELMKIKRLKLEQQKA